MKKKTMQQNSIKNIYEQFINYLKNEEKSLGLDRSKSFEKHHILPLHNGGSKNGPVVLCTTKNHTLAHYYRYLSYRQKGDFIAFTMRWNQKRGAKERALLAVEKNKKLKNTFWNSTWQSKQGRKGGQKGGKSNSVTQKKARQKVGKVYGKKLGMNNASKNLKIMLSKEIIWVYKRNIKTNFKLTLNPQTSLSDVISILNKYSKQKINNSSFYKLVHGQRKQMYGWSIFFVKL